MLLDILTVFFIVAGCTLLCLNLRSKPPRIAVTKEDDADHLAPTEHLSPSRDHPILDELQRLVSEADRGRPKPP